MWLREWQSFSSHKDFDHLIFIAFAKDHSPMSLDYFQYNSGILKIKQISTILIVCIFISF